MGGGGAGGTGGGVENKTHSETILIRMYKQMRM